MDRSDRNVYWAAQPTEKIGDEICKKVEGYFQFLEESGRLELYHRIHAVKHAARHSKGRLQRVGKQKQFLKVRTGDFNNIMTHLTVMTTAQNPSFQPRATNTDSKSQQSVAIAKTQLEYYQHEKDLDDVSTQVVNSAVSYGLSYLVGEWNVTDGELFAVGKDGKEVKSGDIVTHKKGPLEVVFDWTRTDVKNDWYIVITWSNRYDLAEQYAPEHLAEKDEKISNLRSRILDTTVEEKFRQYFFQEEQFISDSDLVPVYTLQHKKTPSVPKGKIVKCLASDTILSDGELPYKDLTVWRMAPAEEDGCAFGWSISYDLLPLQELLDKLYSVIGTNQGAFGVQSILVPIGCKFKVKEIAEGLKALFYDPSAPNGAKPEPLNLVLTPAEIFSFIEMIERKMETISGIGSVNRGNPEASLKSGAALALVQSMAIQFNSGLQKSYAKLMSNTGTGIINILKDFAVTERVAMIAGKANKYNMKSWTGKDLEQINRVLVDLGNPLSRTTAGKVNLAEIYNQAGLIENPDQLIQVLETGQLDPAIKGKRAELMNIEAENEFLQDGQEVQVVITDNHAQHILEHKQVIAHPDSRKDPNVLEATLNHINEHLALMREADPVLLGILGMQQAPPQGSLNGAGELVNPQGNAPDLPNMPNQPENPLTGETVMPNEGMIG